jgi:uncharacterized protein YegP (UPF0339 family)
MAQENRAYFNIFKSDKNDLWYWHLVGGNGEIMTGSEGYTSKTHAVRAAENFQQAAWNAEIRGAENEPEQTSAPRYEAGQEAPQPDQADGEPTNG